MFEIKRLKQGDEALAKGIVERFWPKGKLNPEFLAGEANHLLAAYAEGGLVGFLYAYELQRIETEKPMIFLYSIDVLPEHLKQGAGKRLIQELKKICRERNVTKMFVLTEEANAAAMRLYESTGGIRQSPDAVMFVYREDG